MTLPYDPSKEEIYQIAGDPDHGLSSDMNLTNSAFAKPQIRYKGKAGDFVLSCELYKIGDELSLHLICPRCRHALMIKSSSKQMEYDKERGLSVEPFQCTWELPEDQRVQFGIGLCKWTAVIENDRARDG